MKYKMKDFKKQIETWRKKERRKQGTEETQRSKKNWKIRGLKKKEMNRMKLEMKKNKIEIIKGNINRKNLSKRKKPDGRKKEGNEEIPRPEEIWKMKCIKKNKWKEDLYILHFFHLNLKCKKEGKKNKEMSETNREKAKWRRKSK